MAKTLITEDKNAETMHASLQALGIHDIDVEGLKVVLRNKPDPYSMGRWIMRDDYKIKLQVKFDKQFSIDHFHATLVPGLPVNHAKINGIDTAALEERMQRADWYFAHSEPHELDNEYKKVEKIESDIEQLIKSPEGLRIATILWNNYVPFYTATKPESISAFEDKSDLYVKQKFDGTVSIEECYKALTDAHQLKLQDQVLKIHPENTMPKPEIVTRQNRAMTEQELTQNRREFGLLGAGEAFTEDLIKQMRQGVPVIAHNHSFRNKHTNDEADVVFHLKKKEGSNLYYLNSWDVTARKYGTEPEVKMTFHNNDLKRVGRFLDRDKYVTTFTLARCINYLCDRFVLNTYKNQKNGIKQVWDKAYPDELSANGKMKERSFHEAYGFNLRAVASEYKRSIKDLTIPGFEERFYQNIERGNIQQATFVEKNGKEVPYYVTANITVGCFDVYAEYKKNAKPLTPEDQVEKEFISQEFALKVRQRINDIERQKHAQQNKILENPSSEKTGITKEHRRNESIGPSTRKAENLNSEKSHTKRTRSHRHKH